MTSHILKMCIDRLRIFNYPMLVWSIRFRRKKIGWWKWIYHVQKKYGFSCWQKNKTLEKQVGTYTINIHIIYTWHNIIIYIYIDMNHSISDISHPCHRRSTAHGGATSLYLVSGQRGCLNCLKFHGELPKSKTFNRLFNSLPWNIVHL
jgi:hypothetical protein